MKLCKNCEFAHKETYQHPANLSLQTIFLCANEECREPVNGDMIPCELARREQVFCGIQAKHYKLKEEKAPTPVIELK